VPTLFGELEFEEVAFVEKCSRSADEKVAGMGLSPAPAVRRGCCGRLARSIAMNGILPATSNLPEEE
jgi:hypothetical protein